MPDRAPARAAAEVERDGRGGGGGRLRALKDRALVAAAVAACALAAALSLLRWHEVRSPNWGAALCWAPDCHPDPSPIASTCSGLDHLGPWVLLLAGLAALELAMPWVRAPRGRWLLSIAAGALALGVGVLWLLTAALDHLLESVHGLPAETGFQGAVLALLLIAGVQQRAARRAAGGWRGLLGKRSGPA